MTNSLSTSNFTKTLLITLVSLSFLLVPFMTHAIERVSVSDAGVEGDANAFAPSISADGR